jgi:hypothetical protein
MSAIMNLQLFVVLVSVVALFIASFFFNAPAVFNSIADFFELGVQVLMGVLFTIVGACFYFILRVAGIFETQKEIQDFLFYEIKEALESNKFTYLQPDAIRKINALIKLSDHMGDSYYIVVNDDLKTLHFVTPSGCWVNVTQSSIRFLQDSFVDVDDLVNYINNSTRHRVTKYELIFDALPE